MEGRQEPQDGAARHAALQKFVTRFAPPSIGLTRELDRVAAEVLAAFEAAGVEALLLKGPALAILLYGADQQRRYSDVDLLTAPHDLERAEEVLLGLGFGNSCDNNGIDDIGGVVHAETWTRTAPGSNDQTMIDLHRRLPGARATPAMAWAALAARRTSIEIGGGRAPVLDQAGQAMHLAMHAAQHGPAFPKHVDELASSSRVGPPPCGILRPCSPASSTLPRPSPRAFACCQRALWSRRDFPLGHRPSSTGRSGIDTSDHEGRFTCRRSRAPPVRASASRSCAARCSRLGCGSRPSIPGPPRAGRA
jgi:hypothetical protein